MGQRSIVHLHSLQIYAMYQLGVEFEELEVSCDFFCVIILPFLPFTVVGMNGRIKSQ